MTLKSTFIVSSLCLLSFVTAAAYVGSQSLSQQPQLSCSNFRSQQEAQRSYSTQLDRDKDGQACENLPLN